jgi:hypothetical protein
MVPFALVLWTVWFTDHGRDLTGGQLRTREEPNRHHLPRNDRDRRSPNRGTSRETHDGGDVEHGRQLSGAVSGRSLSGGVSRALVCVPLTREDIVLRGDDEQVWLTTEEFV